MSREHNERFNERPQFVTHELTIARGDSLSIEECRELLKPVHENDVLVEDISSPEVK